MSQGGLRARVATRVFSGVHFLRRQANRRKVWLTVHLFLGLSVGMALVLIGLTGSILVFHHEIDEWLNPRLLRIDQPAGGPSAYRPVDEVVAGAIRVMPEGSTLTYGEYSRNDAVAYQWHFLVPGV